MTHSNLNAAADLEPGTGNAASLVQSLPGAIAGPAPRTEIVIVESNITDYQVLVAFTGS